MIQTKQLFTQKWQYAESLARHAWRCYLNRPDVKADEMTKASYSAWAACNTTWYRLKPSEQDIIREFHAIRTTQSDEQINRHVARIAKNHNVASEFVWQIVHKAWMMWAVERGLADE